MIYLLAVAVVVGVSGMLGLAFAWPIDHPASPLTAWPPNADRDRSNVRRLERSGPYDQDAA